MTTLTPLMSTIGELGSFLAREAAVANSAHGDAAHAVGAVLPNGDG